MTPEEIKEAREHAQQAVDSPLSCWSRAKHELLARALLALTEQQPEPVIRDELAVPAAGWRRATVTPEQLLAVVQILDDVPAVRFPETWMRKARAIAHAFGLSVAEDSHGMSAVESGDTACCVNALREAANEIREVSLEGADILVERARDIEQMRAADRPAAVESGDTYRDQVARALAEKFTPDYQRNPRFDRKRERTWFDAGNADEEPANSEYMPLPMSERIRLDLMVTYTDTDGDRSIRPVRLREAAEVIAAVRDTEMERLQAEARSYSDSWSHADGRRQKLYQELAGLRERAVVLPDSALRDILDALDISKTTIGDLNRLGDLLKSWRATPEQATPAKPPTGCAAVTAPTYRANLANALAEELERRDPLNPDDLGPIVDRLVNVRDDDDALVIQRLRAELYELHATALDPIDYSCPECEQPAAEEDYTTARAVVGIREMHRLLTVRLDRLFEANDDRDRMRTELAALPEWHCPACGATTRARMADTVTPQPETGK